MGILRILSLGTLAAAGLAPLAEAQCPAINLLHPSRTSTFQMSASNAAALERIADGTFTRQRYNSVLPYAKIDSGANFQTQLFSCIGTTRTITGPPTRVSLDMLGASSRNPVITDLTGLGMNAVLLVGVTGPNDLFVGIVNPDRTTKSFTSLLVGPNPTSVLTADFNGDGNRDVAVVNYGDGSNPGTIGILLGNGDGTLRSMVTYPVGVQPVFATAFDFDGDGKTDIAVANFADNNVSVLINNGNGTFKAAVTYPSGLFPSGIVAADVNGDSKADLIVVNNGGSFTTLLNTGSGQFQLTNTQSVPFNPISVAAGDFNKDNKIDLAITDGSPGTVAIYTGNGDGTFAAKARYLVGNDPAALNKPGTGTLLVMDFDGDGNLDLVYGAGHPEASTASAFHQDMLLLLGRGDGTFFAPPAFGGGSTPTAITINDFNGDGKKDVAMASQEGRVTVLYGQGTDRFSATDIVVKDSGGVQGTFTSIASGDFNNDGKADLVMTDDFRNEAWVLMTSSSGTFGTATRFPLGGGGPLWVATGDLNNDGKVDIVAVYSGGVTILLGNGNGTFQTATTVPAGSKPVHVAIADVNGDGKLDLIVTNKGTNGSSNDPGSITLLFGNGTGAFPTSSTISAGKNPVFTAVDDVNGDGKADLVTATGSTSGNVLNVALGRGDGTFQTPTAVPTEANPTSVAIADFSGDGKKDLMVAHCCGDRRITSLVGNGDGTFQAEVDINAGDSPYSVAAADFNGDGRIDLAAGNAPIGGKGLLSVQLNITGANLPSCTYTVNRSNITAGSQGDLLGIYVTASDASCGWTVVSGAQWITPVSASGTGSAYARFTVAANTTTVLRIGTILVAGSTVTVFQTASGCTYSVSPASVSVGAAGGPNTVAVTTTPACGWAPASSASWLTVSGEGSSVFGSNNISFTASANSGAVPRTATVSAGGVLVQAIQSGAAQTQVFDDVPPTHPYYNQIAIMKNQGVTQGCGPTVYCPDNPTTRGQMAVFIIRSLMGDNFPYPATAFFTDVPATHVYFKYIQKMRDLGITVGCSATTYCPDSPVTRGQMAVFIVRARLGITSSDTFAYPPTQFFTDVPTTHPYYSYIQKMKEQGITVGCSATTYCPDDANTRGQMAVFITRGLLTK